MAFKMNSKQLVRVAALGMMGAPVSAFWRMQCRGESAFARIDPLISPGVAAEHVHSIFGSSGFSEVSDYSDLMAGSCTSCAATEDKSAYWSPAPYFLDATTGEYEVVGNVGGMLAYYFLNAAPTGDTSITAFPEGFRMISGDTNRRNYTAGDGDYTSPDPAKSAWAALGQTTQSDLAQRALGFNCLDYSKAAEGSLYRHFLPSKDYIDANCPDGIRMELMFPTCWDGVSLDSDNHRTHVAFPDMVINGNCPDDFPVRLPGLFFETIWDMGSYTDRAGSFVMSNGDPLGFGYHADFIMGWDEGVLQSAIDTCTNESGLLSDCPLFTLQDEATQMECKIDLTLSTALSALADEDYEGPLAYLPGDVVVAYGPEPADDGAIATGTTPATTQSVVAPTLGYSAGSTATVSGSYLPGQVFVGSSSSTSTKPTLKAAAAAITDAPDAASYAAVSTGYVSGANVVSEIVYEEEIVYVTEEQTTTVWISPSGPQPTYAAARKRRNAHLHEHRHVHGRAN